MYSKGHGGNIYNEAVKYDFSVNTNPLGMPEDVKEKLKEKVDYDALNKKRMKLIEDLMEMK